MLIESTLLARGQSRKLDFLWAGLCLIGVFTSFFVTYRDLIELRLHALALLTMFV